MHGRRWEACRASPTWWTWIWETSGSWWWTRKPGMLQSMGLQRVGDFWEPELNWTAHRKLLYLSEFLKFQDTSESLGILTFRYLGLNSRQCDLMDLGWDQIICIPIRFHRWCWCGSFPISTFQKSLGWEFSKDPFSFGTLLIFECRMYLTPKVAPEMCEMWISSFLVSVWGCMVTSKQWARTDLAQAWDM